MTNFAVGLYVARSLGTVGVRHVQPRLGHLRRGAQPLARPGHRPADGAVLRRCPQDALARGDRQARPAPRSRVGVASGRGQPVCRAAGGRRARQRVRRARGRPPRPAAAGRLAVRLLRRRARQEGVRQRRASGASRWSRRWSSRAGSAPSPPSCWPGAVRRGRRGLRLRADRRSCPDPRGALDWLRSHRDLGPRYLVENVSNSGVVAAADVRPRRDRRARRRRHGPRRRAAARARSSPC